MTVNQNYINAINSGKTILNNNGNVTYSFGWENGWYSSLLSEPDAVSAASSSNTSSYDDFDVALRQSAWRVFSSIQNSIDINFEEFNGTGNNPNITFTQVEALQASSGAEWINASGYAGYERDGNNIKEEVNILIDETYFEQVSYNVQPGTLGYLTVLHEIGHALGLQHTFHTQEINGVRTTVSDVGEYNQQAYSVMSYSAGEQNVMPITFMAMDIAALHQIYGKNTTYNSSDNTYVLNGLQNTDGNDYTSNLKNYGSDNNYKFIGETIWDGGGTDTIDASIYSSGWSSQLLSNAGVTIDLREGLDNVTTVGQTKVWIADGANIENAIGSTGDDTIHGNEDHNELTGLGGDDTIYGYAGNDVFKHTVANSAGVFINDKDTYDGGADNDTLELSFRTDEFTQDVQTDLANYINHISSTPSVAYEFSSINISANNIENVKIFVDGQEKSTSLDAKDDFFVVESGATLDGNVLADNGYGTDSGFDANWSVVAGNYVTQSLSQTVTVDIDGNFSYMASADFSGQDYFTYTIQDSYGNTDTATVTINVNSGYFSEANIASIIADAGLSQDYTYGADGLVTTHNDNDLSHRIVGNGYDNTIHGNGGDDALFGGDGDDIIYGGDGNDQIGGHSSTGSSGLSSEVNELHGGNGEDYIIGAVGNDTIYGDAGNDKLDGGGGYDIIYGGDGNDSIINATEAYGGEGNDIISFATHYSLIADGGSGTNILYGGLYGDTYIHSGGYDIIRDNYQSGYTEGNGDTLDIRTGHTLSDLEFARSGQNDLLIKIDGQDRILIDNYYHASYQSQIENLSFNGANAVLLADVVNVSPLIFGTETVDSLTVYENNYALLYGYGGNDTLTGAGGDDTLVGGLGNDALNGHSGNDTLYGNSGVDTIRSHEGSDTVYGGDDRDIIYSGSDNDQVYGDEGNDYIEGQGQDDTIYGGSGDDDIYGDGTGISDADSGDDTLYGGDGNDDIYGNAGNDIIYDDAGRDRLYGGDGNDRFVHNFINNVSYTDNFYGEGGVDTLDIYVSSSDLSTDIKQDLVGLVSSVQDGTGSYFNASAMRLTSDGIEKINVFVDGTFTSLNHMKPVAVDDNIVTDEDVAISGNVITNSDTIGWDANVTVSLNTVTGNHGTLVLQSNGNFTYTPDANWSGTETYSYTITDSFGNSSTADIDVRVNNVIDVVVSKDDTSETNEDTAVTIDVLANETNSEGITFSIDSIGTATHGTVALNETGDKVIYTPNANYNGDDSFTYTIIDETGSTSTATVNVTVNPVNDAPVPVVDSATTSEDITVVVDVLDGATDADGDALTVSAVGTATNGTVELGAGNQVAYTPNANFNGSDSFTYTVTDGNGGEVTKTVAVTVNPVNDAPIPVVDSAITDEDTAVVVDVLNGATDADGDTLTVSAVGTATNGSVVLNADNTVTYTPNADYNGADSFTYTVNDGNGGEVTKTVDVTVNPVADNTPPIAWVNTATTDEDTAVVVDILKNASDADGDALTVSAVGTATNGTVVLNGDGTVTYTPNANYNGADSFTYTVSDGNGGDVTTTVNVTVNPVDYNNNPVPVVESAITDEDTAVVIDVLEGAIDADGDALSVSAVGTATNGTVVLNADSTVTYTPNADYNGDDSFTYTVSDGNGGGVTQTVNITVNPVNDIPVLGADNFILDEAQPTLIDVLSNDIDVDGDALTIISRTNPSHGVAIIHPDGKMTYAPDMDYNGYDSFTYTVSDGNGGEATQSVNVTVGTVNNPPQAVDDAVSVNEDDNAIFTLLANDIDLDGDNLSVTEISVASHGTAVLNADDTVTYTPDANYNGSDSFTYTITDGNGETSTATVDVTVNPVNDAPVAMDDNFNVGTGLELMGNLLDDNGNGVDSDPEGDAINVVPVTTTSTNGGSVVINNDGTFTYTSADGFSGDDTFTYTLSDSDGLTDTGTVTIAVENNIITGTDGRDTFEDTSGSDLVIDAGGGNDIIDVGAGNDTVSGGTGNDIFLISEGDDYFDGGTGDDTYYEGAGADTYIGGEGYDKYYCYNGATQGVNINLSTGVVTNDGQGYGGSVIGVEYFMATDFADTVVGSDLDELIFLYGGDNIAYGGAGNDDIRTNTGNDYIEGGDGNDRFHDNGGGNDEFYGGNGNDTFSISSGNDIVICGAGMDSVSTHAIGNKIIDGGDGTDKISYNNSFGNFTQGINMNLVTGTVDKGNGNIDTISNFEQIVGSIYDDIITLDENSLSHKNVLGHAGNDTFYGAGGYDYINGYTGNDIIHGRGGGDRLYGGDGDDHIYGGEGADTMYGNSGNDTYHFARGDGRDSINNYDTVALQDLLEFDSDIGYDQLWFEEGTSDNLVISVIGTNDAVTILDYFKTSGYEIDYIHSGDGHELTNANIQTLVDTMATYDMPDVGTTDLTSPTYDSLITVLNNTWDTTQTI